MAHVPIVLNTREKAILIIGGGSVAERKAEMLLRFNARILLVSEKFTEGILKLPIETRKLRIEDVFQVENLLTEAAFVIIATDNSILNSDLENLCSKRGILYNRIDEQSSSIIFPATVESNGVVVSVSTSGRSPAFARFMRDHLSKNLDRHTVALPVLEKLRMNCHIKDFHKRSEFFQQLLQDRKFWSLVDAGKLQGAYEYGFDLLTDFSFVKDKPAKSQ